MDWKRVALRLARAIVRFANNRDGNHTQSTIDFAFRVIREAKKS